MNELEILEDAEAGQLCFINGQFDNGNYDHRDMYGTDGHLETLDNTRDEIQSLREDLCLTPKEWEEVRAWHDPATNLRNS